LHVGRIVSNQGTSSTIFAQISPQLYRKELNKNMTSKKTKTSAF